MIRQHVFGKHQTRDGGFVWRSKEPSRIEGFSDAVIGFAVTLLVVSLEVPKTFGELLTTMGGFPAFGICFALLVLIWYTQFTWFRRYGLDDVMTVVLTMVLLFVVLFFVYPLKFFTTFCLDWVRLGHIPTTRLPNGTTVGVIDSGAQFLSMAGIYSAGYATVFAIFALMYWHAWRKREALDLSDVETVETKFSIIEHGMHSGVGLLAVVLAVGVKTYWAMFAFFLIMPLQIVQGKMRERARRALPAAK